MRILITGSRDWTNKQVIEDALWLYAKDGDTVIDGACPTGADLFANQIAVSRGLKTERYPADWKTHGQAAGPLRNRHMVDLGADLCLAFIKDNSRGASGTAEMAKAAGIPVAIFRE